MQATDLSADFHLTRLFATATTLGHSMFIGLDQVVTCEIRKLEKHDVDLIIVIPLKESTALDTAFGNLADIDLRDGNEAPLKAGVIFAVNKYILDYKWYSDLLKRAKQAETRFAFVEVCHTTAQDVRYCMRSTQELLVYRMYQQMTELFKTHAGIRDIDRVTTVVYEVMRETMRLIVKGLNCKYVLWLDADTTAPLTALTRLCRIVDADAKTGLAAGWLIDRHWPVDRAVFETAQQWPIETAQDEEFATQLREIEDKLIKCRQFILIAHGFYGMTLVRNGEANLIAPSRIKQVKTPIEVVRTGFGCVLVKKEANDNCSFLTLNADDSVFSEDFVFCKNAQDAGYKLYVDPTVYCEHGIANEVKQA